MNRILANSVFTLSFLASVCTCAAAPLNTANTDAEANKITARRVFLEIFNQGKYDVAGQIYAPDFVNHDLKSDANLAEDQMAVHRWRAAAPDLVMTVVNEVAEGEYVSVLWTGVGTNTTQGNGAGYSAAGQRMTMRGITIWRFANGRIEEEWSEFSRPVPIP